jgi:hypothetical protein
MPLIELSPAPSSLKPIIWNFLRTSWSFATVDGNGRLIDVGIPVSTERTSDIAQYNNGNWPKLARQLRGARGRAGEMNRQLNLGLQAVREVYRPGTPAHAVVAAHSGR